MDNDIRFLEGMLAEDMYFFVVSLFKSSRIVYLDDFFHQDVTKCIFFENGWYDRVVKALDGWTLQNPLDI